MADEYRNEAILAVKAVIEANAKELAKEVDSIISMVEEQASLEVHLNLDKNQKQFLNDLKGQLKTISDAFGTLDKDSSAFARNFQKAFENLASRDVTQNMQEIVNAQEDIISSTQKSTNIQKNSSKAINSYIDKSVKSYNELVEAKKEYDKISNVKSASSEEENNNIKLKITELRNGVSVLVEQRNNVEKNTNEYKLLTAQIKLAADAIVKLNNSSGINGISKALKGNYLEQYVTISKNAEQNFKSLGESIKNVVPDQTNNISDLTELKDVLDGLKNAITTIASAFNNLDGQESSFNQLVRSASELQRIMSEGINFKIPETGVQEKPFENVTEGAKEAREQSELLREELEKPVKVTKPTDNQSDILSGSQGGTTAPLNNIQEELDETKEKAISASSSVEELLNHSFSTNGAREATNQLKLASEQFKTYIDAGTAMSEEGQKAGYIYWKSFKEALSQQASPQRIASAIFDENIKNDLKNAAYDPVNELFLYGEKTNASTLVYQQISNFESLLELQKQVDQNSIASSPTQEFDNEVQKDIVYLENYKNTIEEINKLKIEPQTDETKKKIEELQKLADYFFGNISLVKSQFGNDGGNFADTMANSMSSISSRSKIPPEYFNEIWNIGKNYDKSRLDSSGHGMIASDLTSEFAGISNEITLIESKSEELRNKFAKDLSDSRGYVSDLKSDFLALIETQEELNKGYVSDRNKQSYQKDIDSILAKYPELVQLKDKFSTYSEAGAFTKTDEWLDFIATLPQAHKYLESIGYDFDRLNKTNQSSVLSESDTTPAIEQRSQQAIKSIQNLEEELQTLASTYKISFHDDAKYDFEFEKNYEIANKLESILNEIFSINPDYSIEEFINRTQTAFEKATTSASDFENILKEVRKGTGKWSYNKLLNDPDAFSKELDSVADEHYAMKNSDNYNEKDLLNIEARFTSMLSAQSKLFDKNSDYCRDIFDQIQSNIKSTTSDLQDQFWEAMANGSNMSSKSDLEYIVKDRLGINDVADDFEIERLQELLSLLKDIEKIKSSISKESLISNQEQIVQQNFEIAKELEDRLKNTSIEDRDSDPEWVENQYEYIAKYINKVEEAKAKIAELKNEVYELKTVTSEDIKNSFLQGNQIPLLTEAQTKVETDNSQELSKEQQALRELGKYIDSVIILVNQKTEAFEREGQVVSGTVQEEITNLTVLSGWLENLKTIISSIPPIDLKIDLENFDVNKISDDVAEKIRQLGDAFKNIDTNNISFEGIEALNGLKVQSNTGENLQKVANAITNIKVALNNLSLGGQTFLNDIKEITNASEALKNFNDILKVTKKEREEASRQVAGESNKTSVIEGEQRDDVADKVNKTKLKTTSVKNANLINDKQKTELSEAIEKEQSNIMSALEKEGEFIKEVTAFYDSADNLVKQQFKSIDKEGNVKTYTTRYSVDKDGNANVWSSHIDNEKYVDKQKELEKQVNELYTEIINSLKKVNSLKSGILNKGDEERAITEKQIKNQQTRASSRIKKLKDSGNWNLLSRDQQQAIADAQEDIKKTNAANRDRLRIQNEKEKTRQLEEQTRLINEQNKAREKSKNADLIKRDKELTELLDKQVSLLNQINSLRAKIILKKSQGEDTSVLEKELNLKRNDYKQNTENLNSGRYDDILSWEERRIALKREAEKAELKVRQAEIDATKNKNATSSSNANKESDLSKNINKNIAKFEELSKAFSVNKEYVADIENYELKLQEIAEIVNRIQSLGNIDVLNPDEVDEAIRLDMNLQDLLSDLNAIGKAGNKAKASSLAANISQYSAGLTKYGKQVREAKEQLNSFVNELKNPNISAKRIQEIVSEFGALKVQINQAGKAGNGFVEIFKNKLKYGVAQQLAMYFSLNDFIRYIRTAITTIRELDTALVDLRKTTTMNSSELNEFYFSANNVAKEMGVTTAEIINQASAWSRLGYSSQEASTQMAKLSSQFASISPGMNTDDAQEGLVSIMKAWDLTTSQVEREVMDNINVLGNKFAETNQDIVEGMKRSASTFAALGQSWTDSFAIFTGAQEVIQNAETVGRKSAYLYRNIMIIKVAISVKIQKWTRPRKDYSVYKKKKLIYLC